MLMEVVDMPNWALNRFYIVGDEAVIQRFENLCTIDGQFSFKGVKPEPDYADDQEWYDWRLENWGTKWDLDGDITLMEKKDNYRFYTFNTAWDGPYAWLEECARKFPMLTFKMYSCDPSMNWHSENITAGRKVYCFSDTYQNQEKFWE
jgi:hypothetical protein